MADASKIINVLKDKFGVNSPVQRCFILEDGSFISTPKIGNDYAPHSEIETWLRSNKLTSNNDKNFMVNNLNAIACNGGFEFYSRINRNKRPTDAQFNSFRNWLDEFYMKDTRQDTRGFAVVLTSNDKASTQRSYYPTDTTSDEIIEKIKRYYTSGVLTEDVSKLDSNIIDSALEEFLYSNPISGPTYITPSGKFIDVSELAMSREDDFPYHGLVQDYLREKGLTDRTGSYDDGSPDLRELGYIRLNDIEYDNNFIELSPLKPTTRQYESLTKWLDNNCYKYKSINVCSEQFKDSKNYLYRENTVDDIIDKIKRFYATSVLTETVQETDNEGNALSKEQIEFFRDSKVRDTNGKLLVCNHYTNADFDVFNIEKSGENWNSWSEFGRAFYFVASDDEYWNKVWKQQLNTENSKRCYLNIKNPYVVGGVDENGRDTAEPLYEIIDYIISKYDADRIYFTKDIRWYQLHADRFFEIFDTLVGELGLDLTVDKLLKDAGFDGVVAHNQIVAFESSQIKSIDNKNPTSSNNINESLLLEKNRQELINKSRESDNYTSKGREGENRYTRRLRSQIANSVRDYNRIDMDAFWKGDILDFDVRVHGETDDYVVSLDFSNILRRLQQEVSANKNKLEFKCVLRALVGAFNSDSDLLVSCTCPDWKYRQAYWATKGKYNSGEPQPSNGMAIANPNDTKGGGCKHVNLVLSNLDWMMKIASVINNYVKWTRDNMGRNYADYIFPKVYGMPYKKAVQLSLLDKEDKFGDAILPSDVDTINQAIERGMIGKDSQGKFTKGNEYRFQKTTRHQPEDNPDQMKLDLDNDEEDKEVNKSVADIEKEKNVKFTKEEPKETEEDREVNVRFEK